MAPREIRWSQCLEMRVGRGYNDKVSLYVLHLFWGLEIVG